MLYLSDTFNKYICNAILPYHTTISQKIFTKVKFFFIIVEFKTFHLYYKTYNTYNSSNTVHNPYISIFFSFATKISLSSLFPPLIPEATNYESFYKSIIIASCSISLCAMWCPPAKQHPPDNLKRQNNHPNHKFDKPYHYFKHQNTH